MKNLPPKNKPWFILGGFPKYFGLIPEVQGDLDLKKALKIGFSMRNCFVNLLDAKKDTNNKKERNGRPFTIRWVTRENDFSFILMTNFHG